MKVGLVLAGGGARGAYQIGVWKALIDLGIDKYIKVVSGTSIGALNAMLFLNGNYNLAEKVWDDITTDKIMPIDEKELILKGILFFLGAKNISFVKKYIPTAVKGGTLSADGLEEIFEKIDFNIIKNSSIKGYVACTSIPDIRAKYFYVNEQTVDSIKKILYATSAVPLIYDSQDIEDVSYLDGCIADNTPIQPVYGEGCDVIIVVNLSSEEKFDKGKFPNTYIIEINSAESDSPDLKGMMDFNADISRKRIIKGYKDTMYMLKPIMDVTRFIDSYSNESKGKKISFGNLFFKKSR